MWELGNRSVIALVSALSVCVIVYNVWGPILVLTVSLVLTIYACYFLIINDSLLSRHAFVLFDHCKQISLVVHAGIDAVAGHTRQRVYQLAEAAKRRFRRLQLTHTQPGMERRRGSHYQLSSEFYSTGRNSDDFPSSISQFSPIRRNSQSAHTSNDITPRSKLYHAPTARILYDHNSFTTKHSTPLISSNKEELENQTINFLNANRALPRRTASPHNNVYYKEESPIYFANNDATWGTAISPKQGIKVAERKTVQTVAGPLLASTRYNIDPKVYNDVNSPGLTTRLTKYAMEANSKLTHQPQYRVGQFPKVNLNASPVPLINPKSVKTRTPMTVRVAPPNSIRYSPPSKQNNLSNLCHLDNSSLPSSVVHLRDISLKRHASRDDVAELTKKQRTENLIRKEVEPQDEMKQKRSRDDSMRSEEDCSPQSQSTRPTKRTKTPSCYDIINSLSSSKHVASGVKRKARDFSRSGTPDFEKHFKSLEPSPESQTLPQLPHASPRRPKVSNQEKDSNFVDKKSKHSPLKGILKGSNAISEDAVSTNKRSNIQKNEKDRPRELPAVVESTRLTHKLFMRAEPERNEKLRMLVEEQGNVRAKFTTDDVEEIKREDIADMRQTSMKARLQSMFDAISGKAASRINPDVVIQAEDVNAVGEAQQPVATSIPCATLNSSTTTTNINTTPISTSVIAVNPGASESVVKHVAFNLPTKETPNTNSVQFADPRKDETASTSLINNTTNVTSRLVFTTTESKTENVSKPVAPITNMISASVPNFEFGKSIPAKSTSDTSPTSINNTTTPLLAPSTTANIFKNVLPVATPTFSTALITTPAANMRNERNSMKMNVSQSEGIVSTSLNAPVGNSTTISTPTQSNPVKPNVIPLAAAGKDQDTSSPFTTGLANTATSSVSSIATTTMNSSTPLFQFGNKINSPSTFVFGTNIGNATQNSGTFGNPISQASIIPTISNAAITASATNSLQSNSVATTVTFDSNAKTNVSAVATAANATFTFRPASSTTSDNKIGFTFSNTTTTNTKTGVSNTGPFTMGNNNSTSCFGAPSTTSSPPVQFATNTSPIFANASSSATFFGTATTTNQPMFSAPSSLNSTTSAFAVPKITTPVFGSAAATTTVGFASTSTMPVFSNTNNEASSTITSTASVPVFGSNASTSATGNGATNLFSVPSSTPSTTATNIFGQSTSTVTNFKSTTGVFGNNTGWSLFGTSTMASNPAVSTSASTSVFGSTSTPASTASIPKFGATSTVASGFRSQTQSKPGPSSSGTQNFGGSIFGTENTVHIFGTSNGTASPFNSASTSNATSPTFGAASTSGSTAFGDPNKVATFDVQPPSFGASTSTPAPSVFGNTSNSTSESNNAPTGIFSFGAGQKPAQPSTTFSFGSNTNTGNNATASTSAPFQFGASSTSAGFNFTAPSTTPSINFGASSSTGTFNASAAGTFSIGSGSTAPRSRSTRARKLR